MANLSFYERFGIENNPSTGDDFPLHTRKALLIIINRLIKNDAVLNGSSRLREELYLIARKDYYEYVETTDFDDFSDLLKAVEWQKVCILCERIYKRFIDDIEYRDEIITSKEEIQSEFEEDINTLLAEDNIPFIFKNGEFNRKGRAATQINIKRVGSVLSDKEMVQVKYHYNKALKYFKEPFNPDYENSIKESMCALEISLEILSGKKTSKDFAKYIKTYEGNDNNKIPPPIVQGMVKNFGYRGQAEGVAHGIKEGLRAGHIEAELMLNLTSSYITYLYDFFSNIESDEVPF